VDRSQPTNSTRESLRQIRQESRQTRSPEALRLQFEHLQAIRRQSLDDFDLQVMIADIHHEIIDRARYLRGDTPTTPTVDDHSVIFQPRTGAKAGEQPQRLIEGPKPQPAGAGMVPQPDAEVSEAAEIPPEVTRVDAKSWQMILGLAAFICVIVLVGFFYLIQTARKLNIEDEGRAKTEQPVKTKADVSPTVTAPAPPTPTLRLYTDLTAGTVTFDDQAPRNLVDGELTLDNLPPGPHAIKLAGAGGSASFQFEVTAHNSPKVTGVPQASNALAVLVSEQDGKGQLVTSAGQAEILVDGKSAGQASAGGLELVGLGTTDHDLQVVHENDRQRFVMTYTPAPVLTVYVKSDSNTGVMQVATGEDGVDLYINNVLFRRKTDHGQVRVSIRTGKYPLRVHKDGFLDPPPATVEVKKGEVTTVRFQLQAIGKVAGLQIKGAQAGTTAYIDREFVAAIGPDGTAKISNIAPGDHTIELRHELATTKKLQRTFRAGETLTLSAPDVTLEKSVVEIKTPKPPPVPEEVAKPVNPAPIENAMEGSHVRTGGGFIPYDTPKSAGHYSFRTQGHVGGILKKSRLQWYAGYQDSQNYILFSLDGKHAEVREVRNGKSIVWSRTSYPVDSSTWVQVELAVKPQSISSRIKTGADTWVDMGSVASFGRDFTQNKVGFYIPPNDEVAVTNFKFANR
jgi:hypothetical protein